MTARHICVVFQRCEARSATESSDRILMKEKLMTCYGNKNEDDKLHRGV